MGFIYFVMYIIIAVVLYLMKPCYVMDLFETYLSLYCRY